MLMMLILILMLMLVSFKKKTFSDAPTHSALLTLTVDRAKWRQKLSLATRQVVEERCPTHFCAREIDPTWVLGVC